MFHQMAGSARGVAHVDVPGLGTGVRHRDAPAPARRSAASTGSSRVRVRGAGAIAAEHVDDVEAYRAGAEEHLR
jgi:hypothetical protein